MSEMVERRLSTSAQSAALEPLPQIRYARFSQAGVIGSPAVADRPPVKGALSRCEPLRRNALSATLDKPSETAVSGPLQRMPRKKVVHLCSVAGCDNARYCRTFCVKHYNAFRTYGDATYRKRNLIAFNGITKPICAWAKDLNICASSLADRLRAWPIERALTEPRGTRGPRSISR